MAEDVLCTKLLRFQTFPEGIRKLLNWLKARYGDLEFVITENGYCHSRQILNDTNRVLFIRKHLEQVLLALSDGVNVTAYTYWSLLDNFEWTNGYTVKFGLHEIDFNDPGRRRIPRKSASYYASLIKAHSLNVSKEPSDWKVVAKLQNTTVQKAYGLSSEHIKLSYTWLGIIAILSIISFY